MKTLFIIFLFFVFPPCFSAFNLSAQMPDWKFFRDREGNGYYYDRAMKIRITDEKLFNYTPASVKGIDYYFNKGVEFVREGKYPQGLFYLKSLKTLPAVDQRVKKNAVEASKWINYLQKKHGTRYDSFDRESTILHNFYGDRYNLINEKLRYKIILTKEPHIIRAGWKFGETGYGVKFGFNLDDKAVQQGYDCVIGIESRVLKSRIENINTAEESWRYEFGRDNLVREEVLRSPDRVIYLYTYGDGVPFSGIEGVFINGKIMHIVRVICSNNIKEKVFEEIRKPVEDIILIREISQPL